MYIAMALYGSGTPWPIGVFESEDRAKSEAYRIGSPTTFYTIEAELNVNLEFENYPELKERVEKREAIFKNLEEEGHLVQQKRGRDLHITYDGIDTACGTQIGKKWIRDPNMQHIGETCYNCYRINH